MAGDDQRCWTHSTFSLLTVRKSFLARLRSALVNGPRRQRSRLARQFVTSLSLDRLSFLLCPACPVTYAPNKRLASPPLASPRQGTPIENGSVNAREHPTIPPYHQRYARMVTPRCFLPATSLSLPSRFETGSHPFRLHFSTGVAKLFKKRKKSYWVAIFERRFVFLFRERERDALLDSIDPCALYAFDEYFSF